MSSPSSPPPSEVSMAAVCRICHSGEMSIPYKGGMAGEPLISPCHCKGTMGLYHRSCLEHWLSSSSTTCCEICQFKFELRKKFRPFWQFLHVRACGKDEDRRILSDTGCFLALTPFALGAAALCIHSGMNAETPEGNPNIPESIAMYLLAFFVSSVYAIWVYVMCSFYYTEFNDWKLENEIVYIVDQLTPNESSMYNSRYTSRRSLLPRKMLSRLSNSIAGLFDRRHNRRGSTRNILSGITPLPDFYQGELNYAYNQMVTVPPQAAHHNSVRISAARPSLATFTSSSSAMFFRPPSQSRTTTQVPILAEESHEDDSMSEILLNDLDDLPAPAQNQNQHRSTNGTGRVETMV